MLIVVRWPIFITFVPPLLYTCTLYTKCISVEKVTSCFGQYICHKGKRVVLKLEKKAHTLTHKPTSPNV